MDLKTLIINCIRRVLVAQGYSLERADNEINWAWTDIEEIIQQYKKEENEE